jgi:hypothetical protein
MSKGLVKEFKQVTDSAKWARPGAGEAMLKGYSP